MAHRLQVGINLFNYFRHFDQEICLAIKIEKKKKYHLQIFIV